MLDGLEAPAKIKIQLSDGDGWIIGIYLGILELAGSDFILIHIDGDESPMLINSGFVIWIQVLPSAEIAFIDAHKKKILRIVDK